MFVKYFFPILLISLPFNRFIYSAAIDESAYDPLYAGTMLAFYSQNVAPGHLDTQPYFYLNKQPGTYDKNWKPKKQKIIKGVSILAFLETGITKYIDITVLASGAYDKIQHNHNFLYGDTRIYLGIQALLDDKNSWQPDLRFLIGESFPTGKYDKLDPDLFLSDSSGSGSYETSIVLVTKKIFYTFPSHPFNLNLNLVYTLSSDVTTKGYSIYGGSKNTKGKLNPGNGYLVNLAIEYSLNRNWVIGMDMRYVHQNKTIIKKTSINKEIGLPSSEQISIAPCIEYNFNENLGLILGTWFTVAGRNSVNFTNIGSSVYYAF